MEKPVKQTRSFDSCRKINTEGRKLNKKNPFCLFGKKANAEEIFEKNPQVEEILVGLLLDENEKIGLKAHSLLVEGFENTSYETRLEMLRFVINNKAFESKGDQNK